MSERVEISPLSNEEKDELKRWYAQVRWSKEDIFDYLQQKHELDEEGEKRISLEACEWWLEENAKYIAEAMIRAGYEAIESLMTKQEEREIMKEKGKED